MNNQWNTSIDQLMLWSGKTWAKYESNLRKTVLRMHHDQLMIISDTKVLESINMNSKIKGYYKADILILIVLMPGQEIRKLRFRLKENVGQCLSELQKHFPVSIHGNVQSNNVTISAKYHNIEDLFKHALDNDEAGVAVPLPQDYKNFIKLCLLDPAFPQYVLETMKILQDENIFKT